MPIKVWGAPLVGIAMIGAGFADGSPVTILLGVLLVAYGAYRIVRYSNI